MSNTALVTQRNLNSTWMIFIGGLLGSVFGLMGTVAAVMGATEKVIETLSNKIKQRNNFRFIHDERNSILSNFPSKFTRNKTTIYSSGINFTSLSISSNRN